MFSEGGKDLNDCQVQVVLLFVVILRRRHPLVNYQKQFSHRVSLWCLERDLITCPFVWLSGLRQTLVFRAFCSAFCSGDHLAVIADTDSSKGRVWWISNKERQFYVKRIYDLVYSVFRQVQYF